MAELDLRAQNAHEPLVFPRLLNEIASPSAHRFDGNVDAAPSRHYDDRERAVQCLNLREQREALFARSCVSAVVQVDKQDVEFFGGKLFHHRFRRGDSIDAVAFAFQQQAKRFSHVRLIVCDKNSRDDRSAGRNGLACFHAANGHYSSESFNLRSYSCVLAAATPAIRGSACTLPVSASSMLMPLFTSVAPIARSSSTRDFA